MDFSNNLLLTDNIDQFDALVLNNFSSSSLESVIKSELSETSFLENLIFGDGNNEYGLLDELSALEVYQAYQKKTDDDRDSNLDQFWQCTHCNVIFEDALFNEHVCEYDENGAKIQVDDTERMDCSESIVEPTKNMTVHEHWFNQITQNNIKINKILKDIHLKKGKEDKNKGSSHFQCSVCFRKFVHESGLTRHMDKHVGDLLPLPNISIQNDIPKQLVIRCMCGEIFATKKEALIHTQKMHIEERETGVWRMPWSEMLQDGVEIKGLRSEKNCQDLTAVKSEQDYLVDSIFDKLQPMFVSKIMQCDFCDSMFLDKMSLHFHISQHVPSAGYQCQACDIKGMTLKEILLHRRSECIVFIDYRLNQLNSLKRSWICNVCDHDFQSVDRLVDHRYQALHFFPRVEWFTNELCFACEYCNTSFSEVHKLIVHHEEKHMSKLRKETSTVPLADSDVKRTQSGNTYSAYTSTKWRQYLCDVCGKSYTQSSHLWQHLRFHRGVKPFACTFEKCNRRFTIRPDLNDHIRKCHTGERPYHCEICDKRFLTGSVFYQHRLIHRGERRYGCEECGKRFYRADALKNHQRIHTGEKPYTCDVCKKSFRQRGDRDKHISARHPNSLPQSPLRKKAKFQSFGRGRSKNNTSLYSKTSNQ